MTTKQKLKKLNGLLKGYGSAVIAFSGGTDSTLLAVLAKQALGDKHLAITAVSPTYAAEEKGFARTMGRELQLNHAIIETDELDDMKFAANPVDRCYHCKNHLFKILSSVAFQKGFRNILDGTNADDGADFRPGRKAALEWEVKSPLAEAGLTKAEIRKTARQMGLPNWHKPANACLASRIPYGTQIDAGTLAKIEKAERALSALGFAKLRVRHHGDVARIEVLPADFAKMIKRKTAIVKKVRQAGYKFVTLDLCGYQMGCFNP